MSFPAQTPGPAIPVAESHNLQHRQGGNAGGNAAATSASGNAQSSTNPSVSVTQITIPSTAPVGGILMTQPALTAALSYYKIAPNLPITFGWNLTSLFITPASLTVSAFCSANGNTYPVGPTDGVIPGSATQVVWDMFSYQQAHPTQPLIIASYTLQIVDNHGLTAVPAPGRFTPFQGAAFALYSPQPYTPLSSWTCSGCSSASLNAGPSPLLISIFATFLALILGGWGVLRRV